MSRCPNIAMAAALFGGLATCTTPALAETVGRVTALQTSVSRGGQALSEGSGISLGDRLRSNDTGLGVILFKDQSSAKIGPNSSLTIDDFVYGAGAGSTGIRMDRGITRFFGGQISKKGRMQITTPHVVLAVRGGIVDLAVGSQTVATLRAGKLTCSANGVTKVITKPGFSCVADNGGLSTMRSAFNFSILDSTNKVAGTNEPGTRGPDVDAKAPCSGPAAFLVDRCKSRDAQLPGGVTGGRGSPRIPSTGGGDNGPGTFPTTPPTTGP
ncbi:hypothetical protein E2A64_03320 [Pseudohoeflea suaedae]|uniref:FecR protein domain-containing protein n=1 Tax=Pseudohoeflea suaedae TaxID=877384 RepID=A0A4V3A7B9_9HYPH|nr:FecR domain-containing protein [Pseudohoeflea suaedae]TDH38165.1 hypothetical protein E2A64_03320 [Pseudohoeflea suaedae]